MSSHRRLRASSAGVASLEFEQKVPAPSRLQPETNLPSATLGINIFSEEQDERAEHQENKNRRVLSKPNRKRKESTLFARITGPRSQSRTKSESRDYVLQGYIRPRDEFLYASRTRTVIWVFLLLTLNELNLSSENG